ncbi:MAG: hypothetical protein RLZZ393_547 [Pseudomonadota bacterium]|jgi:type IV pilus assembly protein PilE
MEAIERRSPFPALRQQGFTLIELMVVVAIVAILAAVSIPAYRDQLRRGAIEEATSTLGSGRVALEQHYLDHLTYVDGACPAATGHFSFGCTRTATTYTITATGQGLVAGFILTINQSDTRTSSGPWGNGNCWIMRKGDGC